MLFCRGKGAVVGFLKMGHKKLFIYDSHGGQHESDPLCALDFYVHESRQRMGCGRKLFDNMLSVSLIQLQYTTILHRPCGYYYRNIYYTM